MTIPKSQGTSYTIFGQNLGSLGGDGLTQVSINQNILSTCTNPDGDTNHTRLICNVTASVPTSSKMRITINNQQSNQFNIPTITGSKAGEPSTLSGFGFDTIPSDIVIYYNGILVHPTNISNPTATGEQTITYTPPKVPTTVADVFVVATAGNFTSNQVSINLVEPDLASTVFTPMPHTIGSEVSLGGKNFPVLPNNITVVFDGGVVCMNARAVSNGNNNINIICWCPPGVGSGIKAVLTINGIVKEATLSYLPPLIEDIVVLESQQDQDSSTLIVATGKEFGLTPSVSMSNMNQSFIPTALVQSNDTTIVFEVPRNLSSGNWTVTVGAGNQLANMYSIIKPNITNIVLNQTTPTSVLCMINGIHLSKDVEVTIDGETCIVDQSLIIVGLYVECNADFESLSKKTMHLVKVTKGDFILSMNTTLVQISIPNINGTKGETDSLSANIIGIIVGCVVVGLFFIVACMSIAIFTRQRCIKIQNKKLPIPVLGHTHDLKKWRGFPTWREFKSGTVGREIVCYPIKNVSEVYPTSENVETFDLCSGTPLEHLGKGLDTEASVEIIRAYTLKKRVVNKERPVRYFIIVAPIGSFIKYIGETSNPIGVGVSAIVSTVFINGIEYANKQIFDLAKLVKEFQLLNSLRNATHVVKMIGFSLDSSSNNIGIKELRSVGIFHRDLHPGNILVDSKAGDTETPFIDIILKIGDLGASRFVNESSTLTPIEGGVHAAPEILTGRYDASVDIYSLGIIVYFMIARSFPFRCSGIELNKIHQVFSTGRIPKYPANGAALVAINNDMLNLDPSKRPDIDTLIQRFTEAPEIFVTLDYLAQQRANPVEKLVEGVDYSYRSKIDLGFIRATTTTSSHG
eukprot:gene15392-18253_t